jgi:hypothetical protein
MRRDHALGPLDGRRILQCLGENTNAPTLRSRRLVEALISCPKALAEKGPLYEYTLHGYP